MGFFDSHLIKLSFKVFNTCQTTQTGHDLQVKPSTEEGKKQRQTEEMNSSTHPESTQGASQRISALQVSPKGKTRI